MWLPSPIFNPCSRGNNMHPLCVCLTGSKRGPSKVLFWIPDTIPPRSSSLEVCSLQTAGGSAGSQCNIHVPRTTQTYGKDSSSCCCRCRVVVQEEAVAVVVVEVAVVAKEESAAAAAAGVVVVVVAAAAVAVAAAVVDGAVYLSYLATFSIALLILKVCWAHNSVVWLINKKQG